MILTFSNNGTYQSSFVQLPFVAATPGDPPIPTRYDNPRARQAIGVNQPPGGGTHYPFVRPSPDIQLLLGDFYLSYPDDTCKYAHPFRIQWLYGFGDNSVSPPSGYPAPTHDYDVIVKDANGLTVFDSTLTGYADSYYYTEKPWGDRLLILEWVQIPEDIVCRCTKYTGWDSFSTGQQDYDNYIVPDVINPDNTPGGILDPRTYNKLPQRLKSMRVGLEKMIGNISFREGYNINVGVNTGEEDIADLTLIELGIPYDTNELVEGKRLVNRMQINATPGLGKGVYPGCESTVPYIRRINSAGGDECHNVTLDTGHGCIRVQRPVSLVSSYPREFTYTSPALSTVEKAASAVEILNDCAACCDCDYFAQTYEGLKRQWFAYDDLAKIALSSRTYHEDNIARWEYQKACREGDPFSLRATIQPECKSHIGVTFGNTSKCCLVGVHVRLTFYLYRNGNLVTYPTNDPCDEVTAIASVIEGSPQHDGPITYELLGEFPVYEATIAYLNPESPFRIAFKLCIPSCEAVDSIKFVAHSWWENHVVPDGIDACLYPQVSSGDIPTSIWSAANMPMPPYPIRYMKSAILQTLNPNNGYCTAACPPPPEECE